MLKATLSVRARILAIALIPSVALLVIGVSAAGYLVAQGFHARNWASELEKAEGIGVSFAETVQEERRLSLAELAGDPAAPAQLVTQRQRTDTAMNGIGQVSGILTSLDASTIQDTASMFATLVQQVSAMRHQVDSRAVKPLDAYTFYSHLTGVISSGLAAVARNAPDAAIGAEQYVTFGLYQTGEAMSRANAIGLAGASPEGLTPDELTEFGHQAGAYHVQLENLLPSLTPQEQSDYQALVKSTAWQQVSSMESAIVQRAATLAGTRNVPPLPLSVPDWQNAAGQVSAGLQDLWKSHNQYGIQFALDDGNKQARNFSLAGAAVLLIAIAAFLVALRLTNRMVGRLKRLRRETLSLADEQLPDIMGRLREGQPVDLGTEVTPLDHGKDEIGQVADAFNRAQFAAIEAAVTEAKTREGVNAVFLNIAHRSQVVVHRQLEILDKAEYEQEDPDQLDMLFQLDHLATRERRNAENLIILGGEQPGRRWRNPVALVELVRSAVAETENYARVRTVRLPDVSVVGNVVADLIHLLAELVDNATSFSPPESRVEISGNVVGKGVVVEITDQGLGMPPEDLERANETLRKPPDFSVTTLSSDSRLGIFVVAQLAARNGVSVRLVESDYGGVRAIVLVPSSLLADKPPTEPANGSAEQDGPQRPRHRRAAMLADD
ncbi:MAG TPA: nitrate- and nitrite sensing domain-containing protein [Amycolatopsis sp.]|nr:nitrate- and nitrite sensing domain-containing protein [Amycolatopsis sp.]